MIVNIERAQQMMAAAEGNHIIVDSIAKTANVLRQYENATVSVSGGSDSDIILDLVANLDKQKTTRYVFFNTGLEYQATKDHLDYLEDKYQIEIDRVRPEKPIPLAVLEHGVPFLSKYTSEMIGRLQRHGFQWENETFDVLKDKYPRCVSALRWWCNANKAPETGKSMWNIDRNVGLKRFILDNPPPFPVSNKCCYYTKKKVAHDYDKDHGIDLKILGLRRAEGGVRSASKTCFDQRTGNFDIFKPIFWYKQSDKSAYKSLFGLRYSDCYEMWGFKRTGCVGCPFNRRHVHDAQITEKYEPKLNTAAQAVFGKSYEYTKAYREFVERIKSQRSGG